MHQAEIIVLLLTAVGVLAVLAHKITLPYPIVLVLGGLALSFVPRLPAVNLNPDVVFYFILPAIIYPAALFTSWRDFRRNLRPILLLAIGLVLATTLAVAWIAHSIVPALPWAAAFALGAIVSPPDAVAATAIIRRVGVPHRIQVILEGESLVNDATALVAHALYRLSARRTNACLWRFGDSCRRHLSWLALPADDQRADPPPSLCVLGNDRVRSQRIRLHRHRSATSQNPARVESRIAHWRVYECDRNLRHGNFSPFRVGNTGDLSVSPVQKRTTGARLKSIVAVRCDRWLGWHAWRGVTRGRVRIAAGVAHRPTISRARLHFVSRLFSDPGDASVTGFDTAGVDSEARRTTRRGDRGRGGPGAIRRK